MRWYQEARREGDERRDGRARKSGLYLVGESFSASVRERMTYRDASQIEKNMYIYIMIFQEVI